MTLPFPKSLPEFQRLFPNDQAEWRFKVEASNADARARWKAREAVQVEIEVAGHRHLILEKVAREVERGRLH